MSIQDGIQTVNNALRALGVDPSVAQAPDSGGSGWVMPVEKSLLFLNVVDSDGLVMLNITSPILFMPPIELLPFYRKLLDLNSRLPGVSLALDRDIVCVISHHALDGLSQNAVEGILQSTGKLADALSEGLWAEFRSARYWKA